MTNLSFDSNRKIKKAAGILHAVIKATAVVIGIIVADLAIAVFLSPRPVQAEENRPQELVKHLEARHQTRYEVKVRESLVSQKEFGNPASALQTLDHLFGKIEMKVRPRTKYNKEEAIEALKAIDGVLKEEGKFEYRRNNLLIEGLKKQKNGKRFIDCDDYSSIYLFAGERLGLSLEPVYVPQHVFLRCMLDDYTSFYWEPTIATEKDAGFYRDWLNIPDENSYPKVLDDKEFDAIHFCNLGVAWYEKGDYEKVIEYSEKAIRLDPKYAVAFNNLGAAHAKQGNLDVAMECYKKATSLNPNYAAAFSNIGVTFYRLGFLEKAVEYFEKAIELDPQFDQAYNNKIIVLIENGERNRALSFVNEIHDLKQRNAPHLRN